MLEENRSESYTYEAGKYCVSHCMKQQFDKDGYIIIKSLLSVEELSHLRSSLESDDGILKHSYGVNDGQGRSSRLCVWNHPGDDVTGMVGRCEKVAGTMEQLLGGEVYHYHTKLIMKEAHTGGAFVWHQDYGYWYNNGCLYPDMGTAFIAIDKCDKKNGCLKVLKGSHLLGRIDHTRIGGQTGADMERVKMIEEILPLVHVELDSGDALFFHCNLLHCSDQNSSNHRRWAFLIAYNRASNNPVISHRHPMYTPLIKVPDSAILECKTVTDLSGKDFIDPNNDHTSIGRQDTA